MNTPPSAAPPRRYAEGTEVTAERSRAELETMLRKHGASEFGVYTSDEKTIYMYRLGGRMVRHIVEYPPLKFAVNEVAKRKALEKAQRDRDAEWRRRWRALVLVCKAKLEMIASGGSTVEREFLADMLLPSGETIGEAMAPRLAQAYENGQMPELRQLFLGPGKS